MKGAATALALVALAACGRDPAPGSEPEGAAASTRPAATSTAAPAAAPARQFGSVSGLHGETSALAGSVTGFTVTVTDTATVATLAADTLFDFDEARLTPAAAANLRRVADLVARGGAGPVVVTGHTDAKGSAPYNLDLSRRRAQAVVDWLRNDAALAARTFTVVGKGAADPVAPNTRPDGGDDPDGRARNRRVVVTIPR